MRSGPLAWQPIVPQRWTRHTCDPPHPTPSPPLPGRCGCRLLVAEDGVYSWPCLFRLELVFLCRIIPLTLSGFSCRAGPFWFPAEPLGSCHSSANLRPCEFAAAFFLSVLETAYGTEVTALQSLCRPPKKVTIIRVLASAKKKLKIIPNRYRD